MVDFSFKNHVRPTVDQLCGLNSLALGTLGYRRTILPPTRHSSC